MQGVLDQYFVLLPFCSVLRFVDLPSPPEALTRCITLSAGDSLKQVQYEYTCGIMHMHVSLLPFVN